MNAHVIGFKVSAGRVLPLFPGSLTPALYGHAAGRFCVQYSLEAPALRRRGFSFSLARRRFSLAFPQLGVGSRSSDAQSVITAPKFIEAPTRSNEERSRSSKQR